MTTDRAPVAYWADICRANLAAAKVAREDTTASRDDVAGTKRRTSEQLPPRH